MLTQRHGPIVCILKIVRVGHSLHVIRSLRKRSILFNDAEGAPAPETLRQMDRRVMPLWKEDAAATSSISPKG